MIVLDTNVVSELMLPSPAASVIDWVSRQAMPTLYLSAISEAELRYGVEILPAGQRRESLLGEIEGMLLEDFAGRILPFDSYAAQAYAAIASERRAAGHPHQPRRLSDRVHRSLRESIGRDERRERLRGVWDRRDQSLVKRVRTRLYVSSKVSPLHAPLTKPAGGPRFAGPPPPSPRSRRTRPLPSTPSRPLSATSGPGLGSASSRRRRPKRSSRSNLPDGRPGWRRRGEAGTPP